MAPAGAQVCVGPTPGRGWVGEDCHPALGPEKQQWVETLGLHPQGLEQRPRSTPQETSEILPAVTEHSQQGDLPCPGRHFPVSGWACLGQYCQVFGNRSEALVPRGLGTAGTWLQSLRRGDEDERHCCPGAGCLLCLGAGACCPLTRGGQACWLDSCAAVTTATSGAA